MRRRHRHSHQVQEVDPQKLLDQLVAETLSGELRWMYYPGITLYSVERQSALIKLDGAIFLSLRVTSPGDESHTVWSMRGRSLKTLCEAVRAQIRERKKAQKQIKVCERAELKAQRDEAQSQAEQLRANAYKTLL